MLQYTITGKTEEEGYTAISIEITKQEALIGYVSLMVDENGTYLERIDVEEELRGQGYGTEIIKHISSEYSNVFAAPDNEDARRLYDRIGWEMNAADYSDFGCYVDQGYGVYSF